MGWDEMGYRGEKEINPSIGLYYLLSRLGFRGCDVRHLLLS